MEYVILQSEHSNELEEMVIAKLNDGWELAGGVSVVLHPEWGFMKFTQALIRDE